QEFPNLQSIVEAFDNTYHTAIEIKVEDSIKISLFDCNVFLAAADGLRAISLKTFARGQAKELEKLPDELKKTKPESQALIDKDALERNVSWLLDVVLL
ncbi:hypothetical protein FOQG_19538, partial [Fusarium oxysporum f. sp. raphani 54005]